MRSRTLIILALALVAATAGSARAEADVATLERFVGGDGSMAPGPDGRLWSLGSAWPVGLEERASELRVTLVSVPADVKQVTPLMALADGSMAFAGWRGTQPVAVRVRPGQEPRIWVLPATARPVRAFAIAADGATWMDDVCGKALVRMAPDNSVVRVPVPGIGCDSEGARERYPALAVGGDGAVWLAHLCEGRIVRVPLVGRPRHWRTASEPDACNDFASPGIRRLRVAIEPTAAGGLRFPGGVVDARGRVQKRDWVQFPDRLASTSGPDARRWYVRAHYEWHPQDQFGWGVKLGASNTNRPGDEQLLPPFATARDREPVITRPPAMTAGPDGSVWLRTHSRENGRYTTELVRATPIPPLAEAPPARASVVRVIARRGATAWLQLRCTSRSGTYCTGSTTLAGDGLARRPARFAIAGGLEGAVALGLGARARAMLRRHEAVDAAALVRMDDGTTSRARVRIRS